MPCHAMICLAMLCYATLRYAMLCYATLCYRLSLPTWNADFKFGVFGDQIVVDFLLQRTEENYRSFVLHCETSRGKLTGVGG